MVRFLSDLSIDRLSFWLGFLAATLLWLLAGFLRPRVRRAVAAFQERSAAARQSVTVGVEVRYRNELIRATQRSHLAAPLFSLDEIIIPPKILAPPPPVDPNLQPPAESLAASVIPYLPDCPAIGAAFGVPTMALDQALQQGTNLVLIGEPGSGKTVALAALAIQIARRETTVDRLADKIPVLVHALDLLPQLSGQPTPLAPIYAAISPKFSPLTQTRLASFLEKTFTAGQALLLVDGLDELPPGQVEPLVRMVATLHKSFPGTQTIIATSPSAQDGFLSLGFIPVAMAAWDHLTRRDFIKKWNSRWITTVLSPEHVSQEIDPVLVERWLTTGHAGGSPLLLTLEAWSAYAGDILGDQFIDQLHAYLRRLTSNNPDGMTALSLLAKNALLENKPAFNEDEVRAWLKSGGIDEPLSDPEATKSGDTRSRTARGPGPLRKSRIVPALMDSGLLVERSDGTLSFANPVLLSYAGAYASTPEIFLVGDFPQWEVAIQALGFAHACQNSNLATNIHFEDPADPLSRTTLAAGSWLVMNDRESEWRNSLMRALAALARDESRPVNLRAKAIAALAFSGSTGVGSLFRQLITSVTASQRLLGVMGYGLLRDRKIVTDLLDMHEDRDLRVRLAAILALGAIAVSESTDALAEILLHGAEDLRRAAAEALATDPEEGHLILMEGAEHDDLLVRRAVIFGLKKVNLPWAIQILEKMQIEDAQWVVKTAATQALEELALPDPRVPQAFPPLAEIPWLIAYASDHGIGVTPQSAKDLVRQALRDGSQDQRLAALEAMRKFGDETAMLEIYQVFYGDQGEVSEAAYLTLWQFAASGVELPNPNQFGLGKYS